MDLDYQVAAARPLPAKNLVSVEYPGYVKPESVPIAIRNLGGSSRLESAFKRTATKEEALLELRLRAENPFSHPVAGEVVGTSNILLKVVTRKRKRLRTIHDNGDFTVEAIGTISKTARFRGMADFQYQPSTDDPMSKLRSAIGNMDVESLQAYRMPPEKGDYMIPATESNELNMDLDPQFTPGSDNPTNSSAPRMQSNLRMFPPPIFSRQAIPQGYNYKSNPTSVLSSTVDEETGEEKKRLINRMRWKGYGPTVLTFADETVPTGPTSNIEELRSQADVKLLSRLQELFIERPIWTRAALLNQFNAAQTREIIKQGISPFWFGAYSFTSNSSKILLPLVCYVFQDGPWRDTLVRFSYDPRATKDARFYQRIYLRNLNHPISRPSVTTRRQERNEPGEQQTRREDSKTSHIFDGQTLTKETAAFQLCDIHDPFIKEMINDDEVREDCNERDGWYPSFLLDRIKAILRHKFFALLEGYQATDEDCQALLASNENTATKNIASRAVKLRAGKHNMAKGALRPEDAAAFRLRATLDRNAKVSGAQSFGSIGERDQ